MIAFGIVGTGWRTEFFLRIARACPEHFTVSGLVGHTPGKAEALGAKFDVRAFDSIEELVSKTAPLFVVSSVTWDANPIVIKKLVALGMPVLSETPPARTIAEMDELCALVRDGAKIQVAEQYFLQPHHAARLAFAHSGKIGRVTQAQVSAAHGYHGVSLIRRFLGVKFENAKVTATVFKSPIVKGPSRSGPPLREEIVESEQLLAFLDFGDRLGVFDFTGNQYFGIIRDSRILVRGERGEIVTDTAVCLADCATPIRVKFVRHRAGEHGNLDGQFLKGIQAGEDWVYRNPLAPARLFDDEIAIGTCLLKMAEHARGGPEFYPLAEACQDRYFDSVMDEAAETGRTIATVTQFWAR